MRRLLVAAVGLLWATACRGGSGESASPTTATTTASSTIVVQATTVPPPTAPPTTVFRGTPRTTTTVSAALGPGQARIVGTVNGPDGPVTGAIVQVERFVRDQVATTELRTEGGSWSLDAILGGSYRVRIFRPPDLAQTAPDVFFLAAGETKQLTTTLVRFGSSGVTATIDPNPPVLGLPAVLSVNLGTGAVDASGQLVSSPRAGVRVTLSVGPGVVLESPATLVSDATGTASWQVRCLQPGQFTAAVLVGNVSYSLGVPPCVQAPPDGGTGDPGATEPPG